MIFSGTRNLKFLVPFYSFYYIVLSQEQIILYISLILNNSLSLFLILQTFEYSLNQYSNFTASSLGSYISSISLLKSYFCTTENNELFSAIAKVQLIFHLYPHFEELLLILNLRYYI
jgi:hypothetical protein